MREITIKTTSKNQMIDITSIVERYIQEQHIEDGALLLFVPHTTAAVTINENADLDVKRDILFGLETIIPNRHDYRHYEGNSDAHIKSTLVGVDQMVIVKNKKLVLGTWQGIYFCEFDGPRTRTLYITKL